jgi:hypothetical protein
MRHGDAEQGGPEEDDNAPATPPSIQQGEAENDERHEDECEVRPDAVPADRVDVDWRHCPCAGGHEARTQAP